MIPDTTVGRELDLLARLARLANQSTDVDQALRSGLQLLCAELHCPLAHVYLHEGDSLSPSQIWVSDDLTKHQLFVEATMRASFASGEEVLGRPLDVSQPLFVPQLSAELSFRRGPALWQTGLDAGLFLPVTSGKDVVALFELFWPSLELEPARSLLLETAVLVLGRVFDRDELRREKARRKEEVAAAAMVDDVTGLYNRRGFLAFAERQVRLAYRTHSPHQLVLAELDEQAGRPETVRATARLLRSVFRETDILGRLGEREFAAFAVDANPAGGKRILERVRSALETTGPQVKLSLNVVGYDPERPRPLAELLEG